MTTFVGRDRLVAQLSAAVAAERSVVVTGDPGIGRTRLVDEALPADPSVVRLSGRMAPSLVLGAFLPFVDVVPERSGLEVSVLAAGIRRALVAQAPRAIVVDDADRLDPASADLLAALAAAGLTTVAVSSSAVVPAGLDDAIALHVPPLAPPDVARLVQAMLPGSLEPGLVVSVADRAEGNPLVVVEVIRELLRARLVVDVDGLRRGPDDLPTVPALAGRLDDGIRAAGPHLREAVETVALAGRLPLTLARRLVGEAAVETAQDLGWVAVAADDSVHVAHPVLREAVVAACPSLRRRRLLTTIAEALPTAGIADRIRAARLRLDAGADQDVAVLLDLAEASQLSEPAFSRRAAAAAVPLADDPADLLRIARLHLHQHRHRESIAMLQRLEAASLPDDAQREVALAQTFALLLAAVRPAAALARLDVLAARYGDTDMVRAQRAMAWWLLGRTTEAEGLVRSVLDDATTSSPVRAHAALTLASVSVQSGSADAHRRASEELDVVRAEVGDVLPEAIEGADLVGILHLSDVQLDPAAAIRRAAPGHAAALRRRDEGSRAQYAAEIAWAALLAGRADEAVVLLQPAIAAQGMWTGLTRAWVVARFLLAARAAGVAADQASLCPLITLDCFPEAILARTLESADPIRDLAAAERRFTAHGGAQSAALVRYAGVRLGDADAGRRFVREPGAARPAARAAMTQHAAGLLAPGADGLEIAATALDRAGLTWFAATAQRQAVLRLRAEGRADRVRIAFARLRRLAARCPGEADLGISVEDSLTERELEIADLVATGLTDRAVADRLGLSARTVGAHLRAVYRKTGVPGRRDLALLVALRGRRA